MTGYAVVIPTVGRPSLHAVLAALAAGDGPAPTEIVVVDDRPAGHALALPAGLPWPVWVVRSGGRGPAAARNVGWRAVQAEWIAFLDDDVVPAPNWPARLHADLAGLPPDVGGSQGRIEVPLPAERRPTDNERGTAGLAAARWITADMAYRQAALERVGGFDERFPRAYREDADLALRVQAAGYRLVLGQRRTAHPVRPAGFLASVRAQAGNADNALMRRRHGPSWRAAAGETPGRLRQHAVTTAAGAIGLAGAAALLRRRGTPPAGTATVLRRRRTPLAGAAVVAGLSWAGLTAEFALRRILPGPRTPAEVARMVVTSVLIPPVACAHRVAGELRWARVRPAHDGSGVPPGAELAQRRAG